MKDLIYTDIEAIQGDRNFAISCLGKSIESGCFLIMVGAGVSMATTNDEALKKGTSYFPTWGALLTKLGNLSGVDQNGDDLPRWASNIRRSFEDKGVPFAPILEEVIYEDFPGYEVSKINREWFFSICSLIAKARDRRPLFIINLNYDDTLEWFLTKFGYRVEILTSFPKIIESVDVVSIHPHGFLPRSDEFRAYRNEEVVLSDRDYRKVGRLDDWYHGIVKVLIGQSLSFHIGLSGDDEHILSLFEKVAEDVKSNGGRQRILGIRVIREPSGSNRNDASMLDAKVATIHVGEFSDIPDMIYEISSFAK